MDFVSGSDIEI